ncbi:MAG: TetR/AcrR family transcriptional regulator [Minwuia sp.]|nr:TetR/AcrR family transcriptional regulator [Minwuia sp.]
MGAARPKKPVRKSDLTRTRVMDGAARVLRQRGYAGTRLSEIAELAGLLPANIYYYFDSKDDLIEQVMEVGVNRGFEAVRQRVDALGPDAVPLARLRAAIAAHLEMNLAQDDYASATIRCLSQVPDDMRERQLENERSFGRYWRQIIIDCQADGSCRTDLHPSAVRMLLIGMLNWAVEWYKPGELTPADVADTAVSLFLDGFSLKA